MMTKYTLMKRQTGRQWATENYNVLSNLNGCRMFVRLSLNLQEHVASLHPSRKHAKANRQPRQDVPFISSYLPPAILWNWTCGKLHRCEQASSEASEFEPWAPLRVFSKFSVVQLLPAFRQAAMLQRVPRILVEKGDMQEAPRRSRSMLQISTDIVQQSSEALVGEPCRSCCFRNGTPGALRPCSRLTMMQFLQ